MTRESTFPSGGTGLDFDRIQEECRWLADLASFISGGSGICVERLSGKKPHFAALAMPLGPTLGIPLDSLAVWWSRGRLVAACPKCGGASFVMGAVTRPSRSRNRWFGVCLQCRSAVAGRGPGLTMLCSLAAAWAQSWVRRRRWFSG